VPVIVMGLIIVRSALPVFLIVTVLELDILPAFTEPEFTDIGLTDILGSGVLAAFAEPKMIAGNKITTMVAAKPKTFFIPKSPS